MDENAQERTLKILLSEAENSVEAGRSKIYEDARKGLLSTEKDPTRGNKKIVDTAELESVYGKIWNPDENPQRTETNNNGRYLLPRDTSVNTSVENNDKQIVIRFIFFQIHATPNLLDLIRCHQCLQF